MGRLTSESTVSGGIKSYEYNELNIRKKITNARGQISMTPWAESRAILRPKAL